MRIFDSVDLLYYHLQRISLKRSESHINSPKWPKNKNVTINPKSKNNRCFKHSIVGAKHWEEIDNLPERTSNLKKKIKTTIGMILIFLHHQKTGKSLNKIIRHLLLISQ